MTNDTDVQAKIDPRFAAAHYLDGRDLFHGAHSNEAQSSEELRRSLLAGEWDFSKVAHGVPDVDRG